MAGSKRSAPPGTAARKPKRTGIFRDGDGRLRAGWRLALALIAYWTATAAVRILLGTALAAVFKAWNLSAATALRAPGWARTLYAWQGSLVTLAVHATAIAVSMLLRRWWLGRRKPSEAAPKSAGALAWLAGFGAAVASAALFLTLDSLRLDWPLSRPRLSFGLVALCLLSLVGARAEELFTKRVVYDGLRERAGHPWPALAAALVFFLSNGGYSGTVLSGVNVALLGLLCCAVYKRFGLAASVGLRWGWSVASVFLLGYGGGARAVYRLYGVSEAWLTGGDGGFIYGLWMTALLAALIAILEWPGLKAAMPNERRRPSMKGSRG